MNLPNFHKLDEAVVIHSHKYISKLKGTSGFLCCNRLFKWISTMELYRESSSISVGIQAWQTKKSSSSGLSLLIRQWLSRSGHPPGDVPSGLAYN